MTLNGLTALLAQAQPMQPNPTGMNIKFMGFMVLVIIIMFVMTTGSQRKKAKEQENMLKNLRAGDKIVTASGILGVILSIKEKSISIRSADTKLEILKSAITEVTDRSGEAAETKS
jgi:preprotein translocase subunit YajC